jgi:hypothetical protein
MRPVRQQQLQRLRAVLGGTHSPIPGSWVSRSLAKP